MNAPSAPDLPLAYLEGFAYFYGRKFLVTPDVLIPRPETETIIDIAKHLSSQFEKRFENGPIGVLDLGTGSGCIAITLALELGPKTEITATDISLPSLEIARKNWKQLAPNHKITFLQSDLLQGQSLQNQRFDLIAANLPYVDSAWPWLDHAALAHEPTTALFAPDHGLQLIKKFLREAPPHLKPSAHILLEADPIEHPAIITFAKKLNYKHEQTTNFVIHLSY